MPANEPVTSSPSSVTPTQDAATCAVLVDRRLAVEVALDRLAAALDGLLDAIVELVPDVDLAEAPALLVVAGSEHEQARTDGEYGDDAPAAATAGGDWRRVHASIVSGAAEPALTSPLT